MKVAICIPTFRRPDGLRRLLISLDGLVFTRLPTPELHIFVIDNDGTDPLVARHGDIATWSRLPLAYVVETRQGLTFARNAALAAVDRTFDAIAFIDDDEWAEPQWLEELLLKLTSTTAAAVQGPVRPVFARPPAGWMQTDRYFEVGPFVDGERLLTAASGNCLLRKSVLDAQGMTFDPRFNRSGGEDVAFFDRLCSAGHVIVAAADAVAYETVPEARMSPGWIVRRSFRSGHTLGTISLSAPGRSAVAVRLMKSLRRIAFGIGQAVFAGPFSRRRFFRGATNIAFGAGSIAGILRHDVDHYGATPATSKPAT